MSPCYNFDMGKLNWKTRFRYIIWPKIAHPFKVVGEFISRLFTIQRVALLFALAGLVIMYYTKVKLEDLWPNIVTELLSIAITVFIINALYKRHSDDETKRVLIQQLGSKNNAVTTQALTELEARGWLADGTLQDGSKLI